MTDILSGRSRPTLDHFAKGRLLLAFDYDGTLAPIVDNPARAHMRPTTRTLLQEVAKRYPCIVISGRAQKDVARRLHDVPLQHVAGNHGMEPWAPKPRYAALVSDWVRLLERVLHVLPGVVVENKTYSVSVHYRLATQNRLARTAIDRLTGHLFGARRIDGKEVVNFVPDTAPGKGDALELARKQLGCDAALYIGDDDTDEDAFDAPRTRRVLGIRVGPAKATRAQYVLKNQSYIDQFLDRLLTMRPLVPSVLE